MALASLLGAGAAQAAAPVNDNFAAATPLAVGEEISSSNVDATAQAGEPDPKGPSYSWSCSSITEGPQCSSSVWYSFQPVSSGEYTIETCDEGTEADTTMGVYTGELGTLALVKESNNNEPDCEGGPYGGDGSRVTFAAVGGTLYRIDLGGYRGDEGSYWIRSYAGASQPRPAPDTGMSTENSAAKQLHAFYVGPPLTSGPRHTPSLALETTPPGLPLECSLDGGPFSACGPAVSYDDLAPGSSHVLRARANLGGTIDPTPLVHRITIDATPPETTIVSGPSGPSPSQEATWVVAGSENLKESAPLACSLDSMRLSGCGRKTTYTGLCQGGHAFRAQAVDIARNVDPTPVGAQVDVTTGPACAAPTIDPLGSPSKLATELVFGSHYDTKGAGALVRVLWGKTTSYDSEYTFGVAPSAAPTSSKISIQLLEPGTTYHYKMSVTTPFGTAETPDETATTPFPEHPLPTIQNGTPEVAGRYAAALPVTIDTYGSGGIYELHLAAGEPVSQTNDARFFGDAALPEVAGGRAEVVSVADLDPATTYHYRFAAESFAGGGNVLGPEGTFTTPPLPVIPISAKATKRFKLRKGQVRLGKLTRKSKKLIATVRGLPAKTKVTVKLRAGKSKQTARKRAKANGKARFKVTLSKRIRKALRDRSVKRVRIKVTAAPPEGGKSSVTLTKRLKG